MRSITSQLIDPEVARHMLADNFEDNRRVSKITVNKYSKMMADGTWTPLNSVIRIADDGTLIDGQHRLRAIVKSGTAQEFWIETGVPKSAFNTIDNGKARVAGDFVKGGSAAAALATRVLRVEHGYPITISGGGTTSMYQPSRVEVIDKVNSDPLIATAVADAHRLRNSLGGHQGEFGLCSYFIRLIKDDDDSELDAFIDDLVAPVQTIPSANALKTRVLRDGKSLRDKRLIGIFYQAYRHAIRGDGYSLNKPDQFYNLLTKRVMEVLSNG